MRRDTENGKDNIKSAYLCYRRNIFLPKEMLT